MKIILNSIVFVLVAVFMAILLVGCALAPNTITPEFQHVSHLSQHMGPKHHAYGYNDFDIAARWQVKGVLLEVSEGIILDQCDTYPSKAQWCGSLAGSREVFNARVGYDIKVK